MVLFEVMVLSVRLDLASKISNSHDPIHDIEAIEVKRQNAEDKW